MASALTITRFDTTWSLPIFKFISANRAAPQQFAQMATTTANPPAAPAAGDELDDLFDYNVTLDDVFRDVDTNMHAPTAPKPTAIPSRTKNNSHKIDSLGIDEEVKVQRKRAPIAKLDEERLLSQAGIPKLRRITKERLRFKGKGHEVRRLHVCWFLWD
jgi:replication fork protection complex subunit Csm3/Swi3